ncbi:hypothetical protein TTHERM_00353500 (macronuclear) [Tetrahymena thermophila SB210]|uniref:Uncharacterized protein n=1 Tax=Tetrahymena thermophila (strain SB210) TaxID=312017 RepID=I7M3C1_TETTS|nr:hypothetical protein TTHERM_00353500 [Tetrahymena thermophila SB210]EAS02861.1 hypothetical protein TTHERM_00353500 [Tetrahymena thermophila SB210]|eukprot:XP_001023106.1 hypothetical protein TTHERM_00353500 [Tetrahymena thermophila SB210]
MARKENQIMMNDSIQLTLSKSQFEEQLLQIRQKIESQQFPRHCVVAAFEQLKLQAKTLLTRRLNNNNNYSNQQTQNQVGSSSSSNQCQLDVDSHLFKLFQEISQQVSAIQQQIPYQTCNPTNQNAQQSSKQVCNNNSASFNLFSNNIWEGDKHSFDSGSTVSYFHDEAKAETGDEHLFHGFFEDEHNSDSYNQKLNTSGSNSYSNNYNQIYSIDLANQNNNRTNKQFPIINQFSASQQNSLWGDILNEQRQIGNNSEVIAKNNIISTFANNVENICQNNGSAGYQSKDRSPINNFGDASAEEFFDEDDDEEQNDQQMPPIGTKTYSSNSLKGIITTNNAVSSSITNIKKGKKANLMHNLKNQLKKTNCCNFDTNDDEDEDEEEYEEYQEYFHQGDTGNNNGEKLNHQGNDKMFQVQKIEENQKSSKANNNVNEHSNFLESPTRNNPNSANQFDPKLFDSLNQKISFSSVGGGGFNYEDLKNDGVEKLEQEDNFGAKLTGSGQGIRQFQFQQNSLSNYTPDQKNISQTGQFNTQSQLNQLQTNLNSELQNYIQCEENQKLEKNDSEEKGLQQDEEFINESDYDEYDEEDETYNSNLDVVGQRESFQEGEKLNFMASQRIHYYKTEDFNEILNERSPSFEQHCENVRNIIMTMSNNYGGLIMFGLGKNKLVQGITLSQKEKQDFIKFMTNIKNSIHNSKQLFCKVSYFPIYRLNSQPQPLNTNNSNQKENLQSPFNQQQNIKPQAPTTNTTTHFKLFDQAPPADFSLFSENPNSSSNNYPPLLLFDSDSQNEQDILFTPFYSSIDPKKNIYASNAGTNFYYGGQNDINNKPGSNAESSFQQSWNFQTSNWSLETSQNSKRKCSGDTKQWIPDKYIIRVFVDQGQKLDATYVYIKNKEITSAIYDKKLKIFKPIYGEPLLNKILSKAQNPSIQAQKLNLAEPDKEGLQASCPFAQQQQLQAQQQQQQAANYQNSSLEKPFNLLSTYISNNQMQSKVPQQINLASPINPPGLSVKCTKESNLNEECSSIVSETFKVEECQKELNNSNSPPLTQEYIKQKRGLKILNDSKKRQIKEKNQKKSQQNLSSKSNSRESYSNLSDDSKIIPIVKYNLIEFIGFEHSDNAKAFRDQIERQIGACQVECGIAKYDTLFFKVNDSFSSNQQNKDQADILIKQNSQKQQQLSKKSNQYNNAMFGGNGNNNINLSTNTGFLNNNIYGVNNLNNNLENAIFVNNNNSSNLSYVEKQYEWMEKLYSYLITGDYWKQLIQKERIFKKLVIDGTDYYTEESNQWLCFQNVKNKNNFTSQITQLLQKNVLERVNLYHQHVFVINKYKEFEKFSSSNKQFQQCFLSDIIKKGFSSSNIIVKSLKNSHRGQDSFKQLLNNFKFQITQQGSNFFVCQFQSPLDSFLAMERLINHRKQKFIIDLFTSNALDAVIELQDNCYNPQQQQQQPQQQQESSQPKTQ